MRYGTAHILATEESYVVGRYCQGGAIHWVHATAIITQSTPAGAAIELTTDKALERRDRRYRFRGQELASKNREIVMNSNAGVLFKPLGIAIATQCGAFALREAAIGIQPLDDMRRVLLRKPSQVCKFIGTGETHDSICEFEPDDSSEIVASFEQGFRQGAPKGRRLGDIRGA